DHVDTVDEVWEAAERRHDQLLLVVRRHDDRDGLSFEHQRRRERPAAMPSHISAAIAPSTSPISAATTSVLRRLRAVTFCAAAPVRMDGFSICLACRSSWLVLSSASSSVESRICSTSLSVVVRLPPCSALL